MAGYSTQHDVMLATMVGFYSKDGYKHLKTVLPIINGEASLSLRLIDWFVTNYAKCNYVHYTVRGRRFIVHDEYRLRLHGYKKRRFDPFCRWDRVEIPYENDTFVQTTIGQLNFFKWALENDVLEHIHRHRKRIDEDMARRGSTARAKSKGPSDKRTRRKRRELSLSATRTVRREEVEIEIRFENGAQSTSENSLQASTTDTDGIDAQSATLLCAGPTVAAAVDAAA